MRFASALTRAAAAGRAGLIAEIKALDSSGRDLLRGRAPADLAALYVRGGADCISVVTGPWFGGSRDLLPRVTAAVEAPVLCKDFIRSARDVRWAQDAGAAAVLVTVAVLPAIALEAVMKAAAECALDAFVEVATEDELTRALEAGATLVAINNRDIRARERTGEGVKRSLSLMSRADEVLWVSASGIGGARDAAVLAAHGFSGLLVGTHLLLAADPVSATAELVRAARRGGPR